MKSKTKTKYWADGTHKGYETPYINGKRHGLEVGWNFVGSLNFIRKWHQNQRVWVMRFPHKDKTQLDTKIELFFHPTEGVL